MVQHADGLEEVSMVVNGLGCRLAVAAQGHLRTNKGAAARDSFVHEYAEPAVRESMQLRAA
jgi:hypothetical protein